MMKSSRNLFYSQLNYWKEEMLMFKKAFIHISPDLIILKCSSIKYYNLKVISFILNFSYTISSIKNFRTLKNFKKIHNPKSKTIVMMFKIFFVYYSFSLKDISVIYKIISDNKPIVIITTIFWMKFLIF